MFFKCYLFVFKKVFSRSIESAQSPQSPQSPQSQPNENSQEIIESQQKPQIKKIGQNITSLAAANNLFDIDNQKCKPDIKSKFLGSSFNNNKTSSSNISSDSSSMKQNSNSGSPFYSKKV